MDFDMAREILISHTNLACKNMRQRLKFWTQVKATLSKFVQKNYALRFLVNELGNDYKSVNPNPHCLIAITKAMACG
jgi:hypothetical protein